MKLDSKGLRLSRICIDGFNIALPRGTGIATYGRNLLTALQGLDVTTQVLFGPEAPLGTDNTVNEAVLLDPKGPAARLRFKGKIARAARTWSSGQGRNALSIARQGEVIWPENLDASGFWAADNLFHYANRCWRIYGRSTPINFKDNHHGPAPEAVHWTTPLPVYARAVPNIYTIHDLIPLRLPHTTLNDRSAFMAIHREAAQRADHIAVVSEATRNDVIRILGVDEDRVTNTYQAVQMPPEASRAAEHVAVELGSTFGLEWKGYFLHFGAVEPKKNLGRLVEAYLASGVDTPLVVVGGRGWLGDDELALLKQFQRDENVNADKIRFYEYMSRSMLISLIRGARATLFPSLYEGFGLPVLEAMSLSTAVMTSNGGALPEVAGDAALVVDPYDLRAMTSAIRALDADEALRAAMETRGVAQAARFSLSAYQERLSQLYAKVGISI